MNKIQKFSERCVKAQEFLSYLLTLSEVDDLCGVRKQFGLNSEDKADKSTDTIDLEMDIKDEFIDSHQQGS